MINKYAVRVKDNETGKCWFVGKNPEFPRYANIWNLVDSDKDFYLFEDKIIADNVTRFFIEIYEFNNDNGNVDVGVETILMEGVLELESKTLMSTSNYKGE